MLQSKAPDATRLSDSAPDQLSSSIRKRKHWNNLSVYVPNGHIRNDLAQRESEAKEANTVPVLLIDSDSETENNIKLDLKKTYRMNENSQESMQPFVLKLVPNLKSGKFQNRQPNHLLSYSIPVSDSDSDHELSNKVSDTNGKASKDVNKDPAVRGTDLSYNKKYFKIDGRETKQNPTEGDSAGNQETKKLSQKHKTTEGTTKNCSTTRLGQNSSMSLKESTLENGKDKLDKSSLLVEMNSLTNSDNALEDISKRKNIVDKNTSCDENILPVWTAEGQPEKTVLSPKNTKDSIIKGSNQVKDILIQDLLSKALTSFTEESTPSDQEIKNSMVQKRTNKKVHTADIDEPNTAAPPKSKDNSSKSGGTSAKQRILCKTSLPMVDFTHEDTNNFQENLFSPVVGELVCAVCSSWMVSEQARLCECKLICTACSQSTKLCEDCGLTFAEDKRLSKFHERLSRLIDRPCKYHAAGCTSLVMPGDGHESSCKFKPFICFKCNKEMLNISASQHFESDHHLIGKNYDVKLRDFHLNPNSGKLEVCCLLSCKQQLYIILNKPEEGENAQFIVNSGQGSDVRVKLLFTKKNSVFRYECDNKTNNDQEMTDRSGLSFIDVSKEAINYWFKDECVLDISVRQRGKKRKEEMSSDQDQSAENEKPHKQVCYVEKLTKSERKSNKNTSKKRKIQKLRNSL